MAASQEHDIAVVGGGLVGAAVAYGLARAGQRVALLDGGDAEVRASRANFALVWVQSKGLGLPQYAHWTVRSSDAWAGFAAQLKEETGLDVAFERPGGFQLALSQAELETRAAQVNRLHNQAAELPYRTEILDRAEIESMLPGLGPDVVGGSFCPIDGHCNSLRLYRALHMAARLHGVRYLPSHRAERIACERGAFRLATTAGDVRAGKVVLAAGNANLHLAPMVGLEAPMRPERGQIMVTERVAPFLRYPVATVRQTDEGTVMIGDSKEEGTSPDGLTMPVNAVMASRAMRMFPVLGRLNLVRMWAGVRVMTADGFPVYDQSETCPGAFVVCCHSGVTLAANHALTLAPMIAAGRLDADLLGPFSARRFHVPKAA
ncbi:MAG: FAD-binding oxidoreductase [Hyphomicrobiaceae bacterium]|nr:FAD-binding oxidoreductase [Hyphomicrobiaceae bacterium]